VASDKGNKKLNSYLRFSSVGIQMGAVIGLFCWLGWFLDSKYNPNGKMYTLIFSLIGVFGGLYLVIKEVISISKEQELEEKEKKSIKKTEESGIFDKIEDTFDND
jgi:F0F1-type ATP synthase assembly protein I